MGAAFTLIELLVAMALAALLMMTAVPYFRSARKTPLVRATNDLIEACRLARVDAILGGKPMQVVIYSGGAEIGVEAVPQAAGASSQSEDVPPVADTLGVPEPAAATALRFHARIDDEVAFQSLTVNGLAPSGQSEEAPAIRFFPNGTCDSLEANLIWLQSDVMHVSLDIMTGQPDVRRVR
jgi:prepilin-type N-terminal cleavage/methylation domain-containing protein